MKEDDILELILDIGIRATVKKHNIKLGKCYKILTNYLTPEQLECPCEQSRQKGIAMTCFSCTGPDLTKYL